MKKILFTLALSLLLTSSVSAAEFNTNLKYGSKGSDVTKLQEFLTEQNLYSGPITGKFFSLTLKAVKDFQRRELISPASGFFGSLTRAKVNEILDNQLVDSNVEEGNDPVIVPESPVSPEVQRLSDLLGAVQNQNVLLQSQNQTLQDALNQVVKNTQPVIVPEPAPEPVIDPMTQFPCNVHPGLFIKCNGSFAVSDKPYLNGDTTVFRLFYWNRVKWLVKEYSSTVEEAIAEFNKL